MSETPAASAAERGWTWFCVMCGAERPGNTDVTCPTAGCGTRAYGSHPPPNPVAPINAGKRPDGSDW